jgi:hypothetical protein
VRAGRRSQSEKKETRNPVVKAARDEDSFIDSAPGFWQISLLAAPTPTRQAVREAKAALPKTATHRYANSRPYSADVYL